MKKFSSSIILSLLVSALVLLPSCKDNFTPQEGSSPGDVKLLSKAEKELVTALEKEIIEDMITEEILDEVISDLEQDMYKKSEQTCPVITVERPEEGNYPKVITKDFGEGCMNDNGIERSGKIIVTINGKWLRKGSVREVTFEGYTSRGIAVSGQKEIKCLGQNEDSLFVHKISGELEMLKRDSVVVKRKIHKRRTILCGINDRDVPMEWLHDGWVKVEKSTGISYTMSIKEPLHKIKGCKWYQSGIRQIERTIEREEATAIVKRKIQIDYSYSESESACDNFALRSINDDEAVVIELR